MHIFLEKVVRVSICRSSLIMSQRCDHQIISHSLIVSYTMNQLDKKDDEHNKLTGIFKIDTINNNNKTGYSVDYHRTSTAT